MLEIRECWWMGNSTITAKRQRGNQQNQRSTPGERRLNERILISGLRHSDRIVPNGRSSVQRQRNHQMGERFGRTTRDENVETISWRQGFAPPPTLTCGIKPNPV